MFRLGLTGSIATGKSTVLNMFKDRDIPVYSADQAVHELYEGEASQSIEAHFPGVTENGKVQRDKLAAHLIARPEAFEKLEEIVHPLVRGKMLAFLDREAARGAGLAVLEVPLLFETGYPYPFDGVAVVICSDAEQRRRALDRRGMSVEKLDAILARQVPQAEKRQRADFVINTDQPLKATAAEVDAVIAHYLNRTGNQS
jgi:dephospho-CoA kinase